MATKKKKKETTIGDLSQKIDVLAVSMEKGFKLADEKMEKGFKAVDNRFKAFDEKMEKGFKLADEKMEAGFKRSDERLEAAINNLALMTAKGFEHMDERMNSLEQGQEDIIESNTHEHEEMKLRQDEVPYRFEFVELEKRVEVLERAR